MIDKIDMSKQEMFDKSVGGLIKQGCLALNEDGNRRYRTPEGHKCAFGQLIPDNRYYPEMEGTPLTSVTVAVDDDHFPLFKKNFTPEVIRFGAELQIIHDTSHHFDRMLERYKEFAIENNLSLEVFNND